MKFKCHLLAQILHYSILLILSSDTAEIEMTTATTTQMLYELNKSINIYEHLSKWQHGTIVRTMPIL